MVFKLILDMMNLGMVIYGSVCLFKALNKWAGYPYHSRKACRYERVDGGTLGFYWVCQLHGRQPKTLKPIGPGYRGPCLEGDR